MTGPMAGRRVAIVSRIYLPEPGQGSYRLGAVARALRNVGAEVVVITSTPPRGFADRALVDHDGIELRRARVLRDRTGYVRGYLQYLSFDVPVFFRVLFGGRFDAVLVEPPPTTGIAVRAATAIRRVPYIAFVPDVMSDAVELFDGQPFTARVVARVVRALERSVMTGAAICAVVTDDFARRIAVFAPHARVEVVGNGFDESLFGPEGPIESLGEPYLLYAGTASEVHGAGIFVEALAKVREVLPTARLVWVGQGADRAEIERRAEEVAPGACVFLPRLGPEATAAWTRGAAATLASMRPDGRYRAFPAKMHASVGCGTPVVYAGREPGRAFAEQPGVGWGVDYDPSQVAAAMIDALASPRDEAARRRLADWAREHVSLAAVGDRVAALIEGVVASRRADS